jgi:hypothetical protein
MRRNISEGRDFIHIQFDDSGYAAAFDPAASGI